MDAHYAWDDKGSVTVTNADGSEEVYTHDDKARLIAKVDPDGAEHLKAYDDQGRLIAEKDPLGAVTEYQYNEAGRLVVVIPPEDMPTSYEYYHGYVRVVKGMRRSHCAKRLMATMNRSWFRRHLQAEQTNYVDANNGSNTADRSCCSRPRAD
jgi:YD repeat-containing protein